MTSKKQGFTLLELSIVLVIIGLIVGGVTVGSELIRSAKLGGVQKDLNAYSAAINTFKLKYNALPGDMTNAGTYWPTCDATPANCNGDGDGRIEFTSGTVNEGIRAWQQLGASAIVPSAFPGTGTNYVPETNIPKSAVDGSGIGLFSLTTPALGNSFIFGAARTAAPNQNGVISASEAQIIDQKIDDGLAGTGLMRGVMGLDKGAGCLTAGAYILSETVANCVLYYAMNYGSTY
jgi:prepilin-type N-terminal cleavage/methylation domain-containing protein